MDNGGVINGGELMGRQLMQRVVNGGSLMGLVNGILLVGGN